MFRKQLGGTFAVAFFARAEKLLTNGPYRACIGTVPAGECLVKWFPSPETDGILTPDYQVPVSRRS